MPEYLPQYAPEIIVLDDARSAEAHSAKLIIDQVVQKPDSVLTLPTGGTPVGVYELLVEAHRLGAVDFSGITALNLDEYWPIDRDHQSSYARYMQDNLFNHLNIPAQNINIPNGQAEDVDAEAERYKALIDNVTINLGFVSIGPGETCHVAFNERGSTVNSRARYVMLDPETVQANLQNFKEPAEMPLGAITQGIADILSAERLLFLATGAHKAWGVARSFEGKIGPDAPASFLRLHPAVTVVLDRDSASLLSKT